MEHRSETFLHPEYALRISIADRPSRCIANRGTAEAAAQQQQHSSSDGSDVVGTDGKDERGYTVWNNIHACFNVCTGDRTSDGKKFKYATTAVAGQDIIDKACYMFNSSTNGKDITKTCTGKIKAGGLVVKAWDNPPLHLYCSKRLWTATIDSILDTKKKHKELGTTHEQESPKPSAIVPDTFKDF